MAHLVHTDHLESRARHAGRCFRGVPDTLQRPFGHYGRSRRQRLVHDQRLRGVEDLSHHTGWRGHEFRCVRRARRSRRDRRGTRRQPLVQSIRGDRPHHPDGAITQYPMAVNPSSLAVWNRNLWLANGKTLLQVTSDGRVSATVALPTADVITAITPGPDGGLWLVDASGTIGRLCSSSTGCANAPTPRRRAVGH